MLSSLSPVPPAQPESEKRTEVRTSLFVSAVLTSEGRQYAVRIRNLSTNGARVEAGELPEKGSAVTMVRGPLRASGRVAWNDGKSCGLALDDLVDVAAWTKKPVNDGQQDVDRLIAKVRAQPQVSAPAPDPAPRLHSQSSQKLTEELRETLAGLEQALLADEENLVRHAAALQAVDKACQLVDALTTEIKPGTSA